jgi:quinoprotein glucose dehydrogenase
MRKNLPVLLVVIALGSGLAWSARQEGRSPDADWPMYNRDLMGTRFSPLDQITRGNVTELDQVWHYRFNRPDRDPITGPTAFEIYQQITPIVVDGVMYTSSGDRVVALRPETGEEIWVHELAEGRIASPRGVSYWPGDENIPARIFFTIWLPSTRSAASPRRRSATTARSRWRSRTWGRRSSTGTA